MNRIYRITRRILTSSARILAAIYVVSFLCIWIFQESLLFHPTPMPADYPFKEFPTAKEKWTDAPGSKIHSLVFRTPEARGTILYFHGNGENLIDWGQAAEQLANREHWNVVVADYPGYGKSTGKVTGEDQLHAMAENLWKLEQTEFPGSRLIIYGRSIGSGLAVKLAADHAPAGLVLESPYLSMTSLGKQKFPWLPAFILRFPFPSDDWLPLYKGPTLIFHGVEDELIPFSQGKSLASLAKDVTFIPIEDGHHNDLGMQSVYWKNLARWLERIR